MASEDNFLWLDPYNFDKQEEYDIFYYGERFDNDRRIKRYDKSDDGNQGLNCPTQIWT